tara:strand:+ start:7888 stop:9201 length:1314 start_codon:yes stop_codon:yes gene_type:complete
MADLLPNMELFPMSSRVNDKEHLEVGGCDVVDLVESYGTPLYIYDEFTLRNMCSQFKNSFTSRYKNTEVLYASKAFINKAIAQIVSDEGLGLDVVSGGELFVAIDAGVDVEKIYFHGNNKSQDELEFAVRNKIGTIVVDNFYELTKLDEIAHGQGVMQDILIRLSPGIDPHTHEKTTTGILDSKFGFSIETGDALRAIKLSDSLSNLSLEGVHFHLGSPIFELEPYELGIKTVLSFTSANNIELNVFSPGGGFAIGYVQDGLPPSVDSYAEIITETLISTCSNLGIKPPKLVIEPGRSIIGRSGVAVYTVGAIKDIPSIRKYVSVDGGMGDNVRPAMYDARYSAVVANRMADDPEEIVSLAGKYCESGDILIKDINLPILETGDIIAIPASGAYSPSMASSYNLNPRPPMVIVSEGNDRLIRRREEYQDYLIFDSIK